MFDNDAIKSVISNGERGKRMLPHRYDQIIFLLCFINILLILSFPLFAQKVEHSDIKGIVKDRDSGEALPYANVIIKGTHRGTSTNSDGYFVLVNVPAGTCTLTVHYIGYVSSVIGLNNKTEGLPTLQIKMEPTVLRGEGVTVTANREMLEASTREVSQIKISPRQLSSLPSIGEVDVFRTIQLLPGISGASDGESGLYVRGGTPDQNLVLFDGMTIYHVDHFFGFFSAFNADAIKDIQIFKGGFPAQYGGRISSVINLTGKTGNQNRMRFGMGANLLSANAYLEIPLFENGTFLLAGRRSYTDFIRSPLYDSIYGLMTGEESGSVGPGVRGGRRFGGMQEAEFQPSFYFYDLNSKLTLSPSPMDILTFSFYSGKDDLDKSQDYSGLQFRFPGSDDGATMETTDFTKWGNLGSSGKWSRQWNNRFHTDLLVAYSRYFSNYDRSTSMNTQTLPNDSTARRRGFGFASVQDNNVKDLTFRLDLDWHVANSHTLRLGTWISQFDSRYTATMNDTITFFDRAGKSWLYAMYLQDRWKMKNLELTFGLRSSLYQETHKMYYEPRASFTYSVDDHFRLKGAWGYYYQFVNRIVNENVTEGSRDFWLLSDENMEPSFAEHRILGLEYENSGYYFGVEAYQKEVDNLIEFTRRFTGRADFSDFFFFGSGKAKGLEFLLQKKRSDITGWIGYTLGKVDHQFPAFNDGEVFPSGYDRRHEINAVARWNLGPWTLAATGVYASGRAYTAPESQYYLSMVDGEIYSYIHISDKNSQRLPEYLRLDLSLSRRFESRSWTTELGLSVFNVSNHKNIWYREYNLETSPVAVTDAVMLGFTPTVYFKFNMK